MKHAHTLFYIHDPMCSWCYGFKPVLTSILNESKKLVNIKFILGGLAKDTDTTMSISMQENIKSNWHEIEKNIIGIKFNYDFWSQCTPKRSTYLSCRAVIAATLQHKKYENLMINAIQTAYYLNAKNPSNLDTLYQLADEVNFNKNQFIKDINSEKVETILKKQIKLSRDIGADSFPSLYLLKNNNYHPIALDYNDANITINHIKSFI